MADDRSRKSTGLGPEDLPPRRPAPVPPDDDFVIRPELLADMPKPHRPPEVERWADESLVPPGPEAYDPETSSWPDGMTFEEAWRLLHGEPEVLLGPGGARVVGERDVADEGFEAIMNAEVDDGSHDLDDLPHG